MKDLVTFIYDDRPIRTVVVGTDTYWMGRDAAGCLGYQNAPEAIREHCRNTISWAELKAQGVSETLTPSDGKVSVSLTLDGIPSQGSGETPPPLQGWANMHPHTVFIPFSDLCRLMARSKLPSAERFERWIFEEVLPSIFKTGRYEVASQIDWDEVRDKLRLVKEMRLTHGRLAAQREWKRLGLPPPDDEQAAGPAVDGSLASYLRDFLSECTEADPTSQVQATVLHRLYLAWATANKAPHFTMVGFSKMLAKMGVQKRQSSVIYYTGMRIRPESQKQLGR